MVEQIIKKIQEFETIIIHRHVMADGDAYGSSIGLKKWIKLNYPLKNVFVVGKDYANLSQFGFMDQISDTTYHDALVIVTDCGNVERIDDQRYSLGKFLIKIDHHPNKTPYGDICWVDPTFTSASEMVGYLIQQTNSIINAEIAETIFYGLVTDSLRFMVPTTSKRTFEVAAFLRATNFDLQKMYQKMYQRKLNYVQAQATLIDETLTIDDHVASLIVTREIMDRYHLTFEQNGMFSNALKDIEGIDIWVTFSITENNDWRVEFRSKRIPINEVAIKWGGGGHKLASGAIIANISDASLIINDLKYLIKQSQSENHQ